jgi:hypothetical protein
MAPFFVLNRHPLACASSVPEAFAGPTGRTRTCGRQSILPSEES